MKAWRLDRLGGELRLEEIPTPHPGPGAVLVRIEATTLMSYMKAYVDGQLPSYHAPEVPFTPGGNGIGTIEAVGADVWQLAAGQRVTIAALATSAEVVAEPAQILIGVTSFGGASDRMQADWPDGTLAEYALLPASALTPVDPPLADEDAARLAVASRFVVPFGGLTRGRLAAGETLIVNGATGAYGGAAVLLAVAMGAGRVVAAGRDPAKLATLARLAGPAVEAVALSGDWDRDTAALRAAASGGADIAFDMVGGAGDPGSTLAALHALRRRGRLVLMGSMTVDLPLPYLKLMLDSIEVIGNFVHGPDAYARVLALVRAGRLDLRAITPRVFALADLPDAMEAAVNAVSLDAIVVVP